MQALEACGIQPVLMNINARVVGYGSWTQTMDKTRLRINAWRRNLAMLSRNGAIAGTQGLTTYANLPFPIIYVDTDHFWVSTTNSCSSSCATGAFIGDAQTSYTIDLLHQSTIGAFTEALAIWQQLKTIVPTPIYLNPNSPNDAYDGTNNPAGNLLLSNSGLFTGTTGSATAPCTTSSGVATSWTISESGNASMSCVGTLETTRTDGLLGTRQVITISDNGGTATDYVQINIFPSASNTSTGDQIYLEGDVDLSNLVQMEDFGCELQENNTVNQAGVSTYGGTVTGGNSTYPNISSATLAKWNEARNLQDWLTTSQSLTSGSFRQHFRTPPIVMQGSATGLTVQCRAYLNGLTGTATATVKLGNFQVRKANAT